MAHGSLNGRGYDQAAPLATVLLLLVPFLLWAARAQRSAAFDDDTATALGIRLGRVRLGLSVLGVVLASVATGAAGPVDFVALLAPQIARRLTRTPHVPLVCSALTGALIVVVADVLARKLLSPLELPVGVFTALVGAPYLMWLIVRTRGNRCRRNRVTGNRPAEPDSPRTEPDSPIPAQDSTPTAHGKGTPPPPTASPPASSPSPTRTVRLSRSWIWRSRTERSR